MTAHEAFSKEVVISGCHVRLDFRQSPTRQWTVSGAVECGVGENRQRTVFHTDPCLTSEEAESLALSKASDLIGKNIPT
ncbi:MAG TPA: hypothetical protein VJ805_09350 [Nitrospiraceae bacterium]|nr:hypothetical protein [Nitrospiraceae bacterium]